MERRTRTWLALGFAMSCVIALHGANKVTNVIAPEKIKTGEAPVIDGTLKEPFWDKAVKLDLDEPIIASEANVSGYGTTMKLLSDGATLFVGAECRFPARSPSDEKELKEKPVLENDCFELFLAPDGGRAPGICYHFAIDLLGRAMERKMLENMTSGWKTATVVGEDRWTAEMAIPLKSIGADPPDGHYWHLNACRNIYGVNGEFVQGLALVKPGYFSPSELMILGPVDASVLLKHVDAALATMNTMKPYLTGPDKEFHDKLMKLKKRLTQAKGSTIPVDETVSILETVDKNDEEILNGIILNFMFGGNDK